MSDPALVPRDALHGMAVGVSVSESADLPRLGLAPHHCELAVAELARAILIAGGTIVYGGRLVPAGFTDILLDEVRRYAEDRSALVICLAETEHRKFTDDELAERQRQLHASAELVCIDIDGNPVDPRRRPASTEQLDPAAALTGLRHHITARVDARVLVGGRMTGFQGAMPGVVEEALLSVSSRQPLYVAGGFGGAAAAVANVLGHSDPQWVPPGFPEGAEEGSQALVAVAEATGGVGVVDDGLGQRERRQLASTHRPADIAALVVLGLASRRDGHSRIDRRGHT